MNITQVRKFALSLPDVTEEPHFEYSSFRVRGKIFVTVPPPGERIHVFVAEDRRGPALAMHPQFLEKLWWGKKVVGLRVALRDATADVVKQLVQRAWEAKVPKKRVATTTRPHKSAASAKRVARETAPPAPDIEDFIAKYSAEVAADLRAARKHLRARFPRGYELVYDNYNALAFGFSPTQRASDVIVSVAGYPKWATLFFLKGTRLADPERVLQGTGSTVRSVRLQPVSVLRSRAVQALLKAAIEPNAAALQAAPRVSTIVKAISAKQRPRRPAGTR